VNADEAEAFMKESEVAECIEGAMIEAFKSAFPVRRRWIADKKPMVAEIFQRFPRYRFTTSRKFKYSLYFCLNTLY
jgi:hypothetical protein